MKEKEFLTMLIERLRAANIQPYNFAFEEYDECIEDSPEAVQTFLAKHNIPKFQEVEIDVDGCVVRYIKYFEEYDIYVSIRGYEENEEICFNAYEDCLAIVKPVQIMKTIYVY